MAFHGFKMAVLAFCAGVPLFCASCATGTKQESEKKTPKEISRLYTEMGTQALLRGEYPQAVEDLRKALTLDPENSIALNHLGLAYYALGKKQQGQAEIEHATRVDPNYSDAWINLGNFALEGNNFKLARHYFNKALDNLEYKLRHRALTNLAQTAIRENKPDEARQFLYQSLQANPDYCLSHFLLGTILMKDNNAARAADEFKKSVASTCTSNVEGHYQLGLAYLKARQFDKARSEFVQLVENYPQTLQAQKAGDALKDIP